MAILLHVGVLFLCLLWLYRSTLSNGVLFGIVASFIGGTVLAFVVALAVAHDYLDGLGHLTVAGRSAVLFWLLALIVLFTKGMRFSVGEMMTKLAIVSIVILLPAMIYVLIANMNFKIGG